MTQIDEKALEAAIEQLFDNSEEDTWRCRGRKMITAYLAALPPTGDAGELVAEAREIARHVSDPDYLTPLLTSLANALTAQAARIAELERELKARKNYTDEDYIRLHNAHCFTANKLASATARAERLEAALREYADRLQKGADHVVHYSLMETPRKLPNIATVVEISAGHLRDIAKDMLDAATDARAALSPAPSQANPESDEAYTAYESRIERLVPDLSKMIAAPSKGGDDGK